MNKTSVQNEFNSKDKIDNLLKVAAYLNMIKIAKEELTNKIPKQQINRLENFLVRNLTDLDDEIGRYFARLYDCSMIVYGRHIDKDSEHMKEVMHKIKEYMNQSIDDYFNDVIELKDIKETEEEQK